MDCYYCHKHHCHLGVGCLLLFLLLFIVDYFFNGIYLWLMDFVDETLNGTKLYDVFYISHTPFDMPFHLG